MDAEDQPPKNNVTRKNLLKSHWTREGDGPGHRHFVVEEVHRPRRVTSNFDALDDVTGAPRASSSEEGRPVVRTLVLRAILDDKIRITVEWHSLQDPTMWTPGWRSLGPRFDDDTDAQTSEATSDSTM